MGHFEGFQLGIYRSPCIIGQVDLNFVIGSDLYTQSVQVRGSLVRYATYNAQLGLLVTVHGDFVLALSNLQLCLSKKRFEFELLRTVTVGIGFVLSRDFFGNNRVLLFRDRSVYSASQNSYKTECLFVHVSSGQTERVILPVTEVREIVEFGQSLLVETRNRIKFELVEMLFGGLLAA